jgi:hypothetical protein
MGRDESNAVFLPQALVEQIAVVGAITGDSFRCGSRAWNGGGSPEY